MQDLDFSMLDLIDHDAPAPDLDLSMLDIANPVERAKADLHNAFIIYAARKELWMTMDEHEAYCYKHSVESAWDNYIDAGYELEYQQELAGA